MITLILLRNKNTAFTQLYLSTITSIESIKTKFYNQESGANTNWRDYNDLCSSISL